MKRVHLTILAGALLAAFCIPAHAQEESGHLLSILEIKVKAGHDRQFREGLAAWKDCYLENDGDGTWNFWDRVQGKGSVYVGTFRMANWAEMDAQDPASMACRDVVMEQLIPHSAGVESSLARAIPALSAEAGQTDVVWVTYFRAADGRAFRRAVEAISGVIREVEGQPRGYWYNVIGGPEKSATHFLVTPYENFAAMDEDRDGVFTVIENARGEEEAERLRSMGMDAIDGAWSYIYRRMVEVSHTP